MSLRPRTAIRDFRTTILMLAVALALGAAACETAPPDVPTIPPLTVPAAVALTPAASIVDPTPTVQPTATAVIRSDASGDSSTAADASMPSPSVPPDVAARAEERMAELTGRMVRPRRVNVDVVWAVFVMNRAFGIGADSAPDPTAPAKMLEMWHAGNVCYTMVVEEVEGLGADNRLTPVDFNAYIAHVGARLSPCLEERWPEVNPEQFFANPDAIRADRVTTWFGSIWDLSNNDALVSLDSCRDGFYAHRPSAIAASDSLGLELAWSSAMVEFSECRQEALREELPFVYLGNTQMFAFELHDRYTLIALQTTLGGHLVAISMQRPYDACWPDFEASIPEVAVATGPAELAESADAALRALRSCIESLPEHQPYAER